MRQIIAMGGGGFSMEPDNLALDEYVLRQSGKPAPRVCFLPTASGDAESYSLKFYAAMTKLDCRPSHLSLFKPPTADLESFLLEKDVVYVGGGNTKSMLALWREWGLDGILRRAWEQGVVLAGVSAGAICWFEAGVTDSVPGELRPLACLGFLPGSCCPHYDGEAERRPSYRRLVAAGQIGTGYAADDGAALHFVDGALHAVVSSRPDARAYRVEQAGSEAAEQPLEPRLLPQITPGG
ncbi:MAG TPA: peptidase E [Armatimonadota bacterium]|nr:peptidase E [Armatimonadota bacterium]